MNFSQQQKKFLQHCKNKGLSPHSIRAYRQDLSNFDKFIQTNCISEFFYKQTIASWIEHMWGQSLAPTSIKRRIATLKVMCRWLEEEELIAENPFHKYKTAINIPSRLPKHLTNFELRTLFNGRSDSTLRMKVFRKQTLSIALEILYATGIRIGELCQIQLTDIDLIEGVISIKGKGNRERRVFLVDQNIKRSIRTYLSDRRLLRPSTDKLLVTPQGTSATPDHIRKSLKRFTDHLALDRCITPHMFRHTTATQLLNRGVDIRYVQKLLGHASITTTEIYTHISDQQLKKEIQSANIREGIF